MMTTTESKSNWQKFIQAFPSTGADLSVFAGRLRAIFRSENGFVIVPHKLSEWNMENPSAANEYSSLSIEPKYEACRSFISVSFTPKQTQIHEDSLHTFREYDGAYFELYIWDKSAQCAVLHISKTQEIPEGIRETFDSDDVWTGIFQIVKDTPDNPNGFQEMVNPKLRVSLSMFDKIVRLGLPQPVIMSGSVPFHYGKQEKQEKQEERKVKPFSFDKSIASSLESALASVQAQAQAQALASASAPAQTQATTESIESIESSCLKPSVIPLFSEKSNPYLNDPQVCKIGKPSSAHVIAKDEMEGSYPEIHGEMINF